MCAKVYKELILRQIWFQTFKNSSNVYCIGMELIIATELDKTRLYAYSHRAINCMDHGCYENTGLFR